VPDTVLVTGGAGFIGSALCRALVARGQRVVAYDNLSFGRRSLVPHDPGCVLVEGDIRDGARIGAVLRDHAPRIVCHLAALHFIPYCNAHPAEALDVNVNGTRTLLYACRRFPTSRMLFASTAAVYPPEGSPFAEDDATGPHDVYGSTKLVGEELSRLFFMDTGTPTVVARFFNTFGPDDTNSHVIPDVAAQAAQGDRLRLGNLDPIRDYIHVDDLVGGVLALLDLAPDRFQTFNLGTGEGHSVHDVVAAFAAATGRRFTVEQAPERVRKVERARLTADIGKLRRESGWQPRIPFYEGIRRLAESSGLLP